MEDCDDDASYLDLSDADGDGINSCEGDCDDNSQHAYPGAAFEESPTACMLDADGDGYGADVVIGIIASGTDCNDSDSGIHPGATEIAADGVDQDCDGTD